MATNTFTDFTIADTYAGILHARGEKLPASGQQLIYDGFGNKTAMSLGLSGNGVSFTGTLSGQSGVFRSLSTFSLSASAIQTDTLKVSGISYPLSGVLNGIVVQNANNQLAIVSKLPANSLPALSPNPAGTYNDVYSVTVNEAGLVTSATLRAPVGSLTITSTTYFTAGVNFYIGGLPSSPGFFHLNFVPNTAKAVIGYIGPYTLVESRNSVTTVFASPDGVNEFPIWATSSGKEPEAFMNGSQFVARCQANGGGVQIYLRSLSLGSTPYREAYSIYILGYQQ
jgi:hypothetical protein